MQFGYPQHLSTCSAPQHLSVFLDAGCQHLPPCCKLTTITVTRWIRKDRIKPPVYVSVPISIRLLDDNNLTWYHPCVISIVCDRALIDQSFVYAHRPHPFDRKLRIEEREERWAVDVDSRWEAVVSRERGECRRVTDYSLISIKDVNQTDSQGASSLSSHLFVTTGDPERRTCSGNETVCRYFVTTSDCQPRMVRSVDWGDECIRMCRIRDMVLS